jgi:hypothetical protein
VPYLQITQVGQRLDPKQTMLRCRGDAAREGGEAKQADVDVGVRPRRPLPRCAEDGGREGGHRRSRAPSATILTRTEGTTGSGCASDEEESRVVHCLGLERMEGNRVSLDVRAARVETCEPRGWKAVARVGGRPARADGREDGIFFSSSFFLVVEIPLTKHASLKSSFPTFLFIPLTKHAFHKNTRKVPVRCYGQYL